MFSCTRTETQLIVAGKTAGAVRRYPAGECPHSAGGQIVFTSRYLPWVKDGKSFIFAKGTIVSMRPGTVGRFRKDNRMAEQDGFANGPTWHGHINQLYAGIKDDESVYHITFKIEDVDRSAGTDQAQE